MSEFQHSNLRSTMLKGADLAVIFVVLIITIRILWSRPKRPRVISLPASGGINKGTENSQEVLGTAQKDDAYQNLNAVCPSISYKVIEEATNGFDEKRRLGKGGFGHVYYGVMPGSKEKVAVKKLAADSRQGDKEFLAEVSIISELRHRNIVRLVGWCSEGNSRLLVYEYVKNGSLDKFLFSSSPSPGRVLTWDERFRVIQNVTDALQYLHEGARQMVIHRDIKPSNIMVRSPAGEDMSASNINAMFGDFGLSRMVDHDKTLATTNLAGTRGYIAPEAFQTGKFTRRTDVYSLGIVLLEIVTGKLALDGGKDPGQPLLVTWVRKKFQKKELLSVVDSRRENTVGFKKDQALRVLHLGLWCSHDNPDLRPSMKKVVSLLESDEKVCVPQFDSTRPRALFKLLT